MRKLITILFLLPLFVSAQSYNGWRWTPIPPGGDNLLFDAGYEEASPLAIQFPAALTPEYRSSSAESTTGVGYTPFAKDGIVSSSGSYSCLVSIMEAYIYGDRYRAERTFYNLESSIAEQWYRIDYYLPEDWEKDANTTQLWQFHSLDDEGDGSKIPALCWYINSDGDYDLNLAWNKNNPTSGWTDYHYTSSNTPAFGDPEDDYGKWTEFIIHIRWDYRPDADGGNGLMELWKDGVLVKTYDGPIGYNDALGCYFKWGLMKLGWDMVGTEQHVWFDNVRVGTSDADYDEMNASLSTRTIPLDNIAKLKPKWKENYYLPSRKNLTKQYI